VLVYGMFDYFFRLRLIVLRPMVCGTDKANYQGPNSQALKAHYVLPCDNFCNRSPSHSGSLLI